MQHVRPTIGQVTVCVLILCGSPAMAAQPSIAQTVPSVSGEDVLVTGRHHADPAVPSIAIKARNIIGFARDIGPEFHSHGIALCASCW